MKGQRTRVSQFVTETRDPDDPLAGARHRAGAAQTRVVIAEEDSSARTDLQAMLVPLSCLVVGEAADGETAVHLARALLPDAVLLAARLPGLDGLRAARLLVEERVAPVLLMAHDGEYVECAVEAGVMAYLVKPLRAEDVAPAIKIANARFRELQAVQKETERLSAALETRKKLARTVGMLMEREGLTERAAYDRIRRLSMNSRQPMQQVLDALLLAYQSEK